MASDPSTFDPEDILRSLRQAQDEDIEVEEVEDPLQTLTWAKTNPLTTRYVEYVPMLPSYPRTDRQGYTYIVELHSAQGPDKWRSVTEHQYCYRRAIPTKASRSPFLGGGHHGIEGKMHRLECTGIKRCQFLQDDMRNVSHTYVNEIDLQKMRQQEQYIGSTHEDIYRRNAIKKYFAINERFAKGLACPRQTGVCKAAMNRFRDASDLHGTRDWYVKCIQYNPRHAQDHYFQVFRESMQLDIPFLKSYFDGTIPTQATCFRIDPKTGRSENCGIPHPQGPGRWESEECSVKFSIFVPNNTIQTPYVFFTSHGIHTHLAPPPTRIPAQYKDDLKRLISLAGAEDLTFVRFQTSRALSEYLQANRVNGLSALHASLTNSGRIAWEIHRQRILLFPEGTQLAGVCFQYEQEKAKDSKERYIQEIFNDSDGIMIFCFYEGAAQLLLEQQDVEVDMSFKRIKQANMNEILFAKFIESHNKIFTFARIIVSTDTTKTYHLAFKRLFTCIERVTGRTVRWYHLHHGGFRAVVVDMLQKQAAGLGHYLCDIDPLHREWTWQIQNVIFYCTVHFDRSIHRAAGTRETSDSGHFEMRSLKTASTEYEWDQTVQVLMQHPNKRIQDWTRHKKQLSIRCGLQPYFSLMDNTYFIRLRNHTNAVEQAANKGYASGKRMDLLHAVRKAAIRDFADLEAFDVQEMHQIRTTYRSNSAVQRESREIQRSRRSLESNSTRQSRSIAIDDDLLMLPPNLPQPDTQDVFINESASSISRDSRGSRGSRGQSRHKRGPPSTSSASHTNRKRIADTDRLRQLQIETQEVELEAKRLANQERALAFEKAQLEFRELLARQKGRVEDTIPTTTLQELQAIPGATQGTEESLERF